MRELFDTELNLTDEPMSREALIEAVGRGQVLAPTITTPSTPTSSPRRGTSRS